MTRFVTIILIFILLVNFPLCAQQKYWIFHQEKPFSAQSVILPSPENCSKWLKACSYFLLDEEVCRLREEGISLQPVLQLKTQSNSNKERLGFALEQVEAKAFIDKGLNGKGIKIGIIDGGFLRADKEDNLRHLFENGLVMAYKDFVTPDMEEYGGSRALDDDHGTEVWNLIGGKNRKKGIHFGLATHSQYYLARTDHGGYEKRIEEDYFIAALEWLDSLGVRLVNSSLGYNLGFTDPAENYKRNQMDGKTTAIARAVEYAATNRGMLVVIAAGNEGTVKSWRILSTPGDAEHALTVGSSKFKEWDKIDFSSIGPEFIPFVKPDVSVYSSTGTSYSTPVITGMAACIWQARPELSNLEVRHLIRRAGHLYPYPNNYLGYGVPTCTRILQLLSGDSARFYPKEIHTSDKLVKLPDTTNHSYWVAYHKKDNHNVVEKTIYRPKRRHVKVRKIEEAHQTSLLIGKQYIEIFWE